MDRALDSPTYAWPDCMRERDISPNKDGLAWRKDTQKVQNEPGDRLTLRLVDGEGPSENQRDLKSCSA